MLIKDATEVATPERIGQHNKRLILDYIRKHGPVSRADLKRELGMSFPSVSANVKTLLDEGYVQIFGTGDSAIGRKPEMLAFNAKRGYIVGADLGRSEMRVLIADLKGDQVAYVNEAAKKPRTGDVITGQLQALIRRAVEEAGVDKSRVKCISVGVPGIITPGSDEVILAPFVESLSVSEIEHALREDFDVPILLDNGSNYGVIGEKWKGSAQGYQNIVYLSYSYGLGIASVINGQLYRGSKGAAGEIGFMLLDRGQIRDSFDEIGALEYLMSEGTMRALEDKAKGWNGVDALLEALKEPDDVFKRIIEEIRDYVGMLMVNITAVLNQELIVLSGRLGSELGKYFADHWRSMLEAHVPFPPEVVVSEMKSMESVLGATAVALRYINEDAEF